MPAVSERQRRAMWAAAEGSSNLGIPESVGKEFVRADADPPPAGADLNEYEAAEAVRDGELPSPTKFGDYWLFDVRVTGTGAAYRDKLDEWAVRDPKLWTSEEFVKRAGALAVIFEHPNRSGLNSEEFEDRVVGITMLPYVKNDEVWAIARIYDEDAAKLMQTTHCSTSPGVLPAKDSTAAELKDGSDVLVEGLPQVLDHLAICSLGVWDKDGPPSGIRLDSRKDGSVADKTAAEYEAEIADAKKRADAAERERDDAMRRADAAEAEREDAKKRDSKKDESEEEAIAAAEREKADKKDRKDRKDGDEPMMDGKKDMKQACNGCDTVDYKGSLDKAGVCSECRSKKDSEESDEEMDAKKDAAGAKKVEVEAGRGTEAIHDSRILDLEREIRRLKDAQKPLTIEDRDAIAKAFHRADRVYQMLSEQTPQVLPGETPLAYRRRLASGLRPVTKSWTKYAFHDSQDGQSFALVEDAIYNEALAYAKNPPPSANLGQLREITTVQHGKTRVEFVGDSRAAWLPFQHPVKQLVQSIKRPAGYVAR